MLALLTERGRGYVGNCAYIMRLFLFFSVGTVNVRLRYRSSTAARGRICYLGSTKPVDVPVLKPEGWVCLRPREKRQTGLYFGTQVVEIRRLILELEPVNCATDIASLHMWAKPIVRRKG